MSENRENQNREAPPVGNSPPEDDLRSLIAGVTADSKKAEDPPRSPPADPAAAASREGGEVGFEIEAHHEKALPCEKLRDVRTEMQPAAIAARDDDGAGFRGAIQIEVLLVPADEDGLPRLRPCRRPEGQPCEGGHQWHSRAPPVGDHPATSAR